jgi:hypothetical protein
MKFSFKKIGSVLASTAMFTSTVALAAAANFPAPYVQGGNAEVALVYGSTAAATDLVAVADISTYLQERLARDTATGGGGTVDVDTQGEVAALFTSGTKLYINDSINTVKNVITRDDLPMVLADESFSGDVDTTITQKINIGSWPRVIFAKQPTGEDVPTFGIQLHTDNNKYLYSSVATFQKSVNFTHSDTTGERFNLFGEMFTVSSSTDNNDLVLLKSAEDFTLTSDDPSREVTVGGETYTIELVSASDSAATIKVTDSSGESSSKEISENTSKRLQGLTIAVTTADETNLQLTASIIAGADKVTLTDGSSVTLGEQGTTIDGTMVHFSNSNLNTGTTSITVNVTAPESDLDAIKSGDSFLDPVFGSFKLEFTGLSIPDDSSSRETISLDPSNTDKMEVTFTDHRGYEKAISFVKNDSLKMWLQRDDEQKNITVREGETIKKDSYVVVGNEDEGYLLKLSDVKNRDPGTSNDKATFTDVFSGDVYETTSWTEGASQSTGTLAVVGKSYTVTVQGNHSSSQADMNVSLNYPDSNAVGDMVLYPTIQTSKGAKLAFYEPYINVSFGRFIGTSGINGANVTKVRIPDGDGYTDTTITRNPFGGHNLTIGSTDVNLTSGAKHDVQLTIGQLNFNISSSGYVANDEALVDIYLINPQDSSPIMNPGLIIFEEKDDNSVYEAMVVTIDSEASGGDANVGVNDIVRTWGLDGIWDAIGMPGDSKITKEADLWGSIITVDSTDSDQESALISYPDEQVHALVYVAEEAASITASGGGSGGDVASLGSITVSDKEVSSVSGKNLIVVGGSCVNTEAANLLDVSSPTCGADFTAATGVGAGEFLIETFARTGGKVATLVAGYNAAGTTNGAKALTTLDVDTTVGMKYTGTSSSSIEPVVTAEA